MALNIIAVVLVLGITFTNSIFGFYSGLINVFCMIVGAAASLGCWEPLAGWAAKDLGIPAAYGGPAVIVLMFVLVSGALRVLADMYLRGNVRVPMYVDWGGGAVCGGVSAMIAVGVLVISVRLLPIGGAPLGYSMYSRAEELEGGYATFKRASVWLNPDGFTIGLVKILSSGSLRSSTTLDSVYPDFTQWLYWSGNTVQAESSPAPLRDRDDGFTNGLRVDEWWDQKEAVKARYRERVPTRDESNPPYSSDRDYRPESGKRLIGARLTLRNASADRPPKGGALHLFRPSMIRVVGDSAGLPRHYPARILAGADSRLGAVRRIVDLDNNFSIPASGDLPLEVYFEVDEDFKPQLVEYRRHARTAMGDANKKTKAPALALKAGGGAEAGPGGGPSQRASGITRFIDAILPSSGDSDRLPIEFSQAELRRNLDATLSGEFFASGRVSGDVQRFAPTVEDVKIEKFKIPEGFRICQIRYRPRQALTVAGQVFNYVGRTVNQYRAADSTGNEYPLAGYFAIVKRGEKEFIELYFTGGDDASFRQMLDFKDVQPSELTASDEAQLGLLFLVPPGKTIIKIASQSGEIEFEPGYPMSGQ